MLLKKLIPHTTDRYPGLLIMMNLVMIGDIPSIEIQLHGPSDH